MEVLNENENEMEVLIENENEMEVLNENENILVNLSEQKQNFKKTREKATDGLVVQAKKMKLMSENQFSPLKVETTVKIPVPCVDRGKIDANNV
jgi:hypothetical protein